jgi:hypothetical protein
MRLRYALALLIELTWGTMGYAEHARITLRVAHLDPATGRMSDETTASADTEPPTGGLNPRPVAQARVNEPLVMEFFFDNVYPHGEKKNVTVRYAVVREEKAGQKTLPDLSTGVVTGKFTLNFKPKTRVAGARVAFTIKEPGVYLIRVDSVNTDSDHEHFSAIDLKVK